MSEPTTEEEGLGHLSPFELKDRLVHYARDFTRTQAASHQFLNAGRGNPNWIATTPRESFFLLGQFAMAEAERTWKEPDLGGMPRPEGIASRLLAYLTQAGGRPGATLLARALAYGTGELGFEADAFVHELVDAVVGDNYPQPDRMLVHCEQVVHRYLMAEMCGDRPPEGRFDLFATEGGTAAMCYVFDSLVTNRILQRGDTIALGTPIFTPYLEIPHLAEYRFRTVEVGQHEMGGGRHTWQYPDEELAKLEDPRVKAFFLVNPSNPASFAMRQESLDRIVELVRTRRPDLLLLTDDVYGTFVEGFRSLAAELPHNTILVYSYSKYFGCTGWRLGVIAMHQEHVVDRMIERLPAPDRVQLRERYGSLTTNPDALKFIDRMVADSRSVALNHTAGLSTPQQAQMALFSLFNLVDRGQVYKKRTRGIIQQRLEKLVEGLDITYQPDPLRVGYYVTLDLEAWGRAHFGDDFMEFVKEHREPIDIVLSLARRHGTVLLNGSGFNGPPWSVRISLANLDADEYFAIGRDLRDLIANAVNIWRQARGGPADPSP